MIIHCDRANEPFPSRTPMLCVSLRGTGVTLVGFDSSKREMLECMVLWCGATVMSDLDEGTSVVVVGDAGSSILDHARAVGIPLVTSDWVLRCFHTQNSVEYSSFPVKPLKGALIALSGFRSKLDFEAARRLAVELGAEFVPQLEHDTPITHLVVDPSRMDTGIRSKYYYSKVNGIFVVPVQWLQDSQRNNRWPSEKSYEIANPSTDPKPKRPQLDRERFAPPSPSSSGSVVTIPSSSTTSASFKPKDSSHHLYLANCTIHLCCTNLSELTRLSDLIQGAGGLLTSDPSSATYVVIWLDNGVGLVPSTTAAKLIPSNSLHPAPLVVHDWLDACFSEKRLVEISQYATEMNSVNRLVTWHLPPAPSTTIPILQAPAPLSADNSNPASNNSKKRPPSAEIMTLLQDIELEDALQVGPQSKRPALAEPSCPSMDLDLPTVDSSSMLLSNCHFIAAYTYSSKLVELIGSLGGSVVDIDAGPLPLQISGHRIYLIVPHGVFSLPYASAVQSKISNYRPTPTFVTIQWLEHISKFGQFVEHYVFPLLFTPLPFTREHYQSSMSTVCLCPASIPEPEKSLLCSLAAFIGCTSKVDLLKLHTTHVISMNLNGKKQQTALALGKHLVTPEWLYCCAKVGAKVAELAFRVTADAHPCASSTTLAPVSSSASRQAALSSVPHPMTSTQGKLIPSTTVTATIAPRREDEEDYVDVFAKCVETPQGRSSPHPPSPEIPYNRILDGLVIHFHKLPRDDEEYLTRMARDMGAQTSWANELNVTHVVAQNKTDLPSATPSKSTLKHQPKLLSLPDHKPLYVAPQWLIKCGEERRRVSEALYPSTLDSRSALGITMGETAPHSLAATVHQPIGRTHPSIASTGETDFKRPSPSSLNIVLDNPALNPSFNKVSSKNPVSEGATLQRTSMTSVVVPKTRAQSDFEEFDTLDARYSSKAYSLPPNALLQHPNRHPHQHQHQHQTSIPRPAPQSSTTPSMVQQEHLLLHRPQDHDTHAFQSPDDVIRAISQPHHPLPSLTSSEDSGLPLRGPPSSASLYQSPQLAQSSVYAQILQGDRVEAMSSNLLATKSHAPPSSDPSLPLIQHAVHLPHATSIAEPHNQPPSDSRMVNFLSATTPFGLATDDLGHEPSSLEVQTEATTTPRPLESTTLPTITTASTVVDHESAEVPHDAPDHTSNPVVESQDALASHSQNVDEQTVAETKMQTEMMRRLLASMTSAQQRTFTKLGSSASALPGALLPNQTPISPSSAAPDVMVLPRHIARSALLEMDGTAPAQSNLLGASSTTTSGSLISGILRSDSTHSSGSERSTRSTTDSEDLLRSSPPSHSIHPSEYLQSAEFDLDRAPRVSYATMEPSEAVKSKMIGRAAQHFDSTLFQENAVAELKILERMITHTSSSVDASDVDDIEVPHLGLVATSLQRAPSQLFPSSASDQLEHLTSRRQSSASSLSSVVSGAPIHSASEVDAEHAALFPVPMHPPPLGPTSTSTLSKALAASNTTRKPQTIVLDDDDDVLAALEPPPPNMTMPQNVSHSTSSSVNMFGKSKRKPTVGSTSSSYGTAGLVFGPTSSDNTSSSTTNPCVGRAAPVSFGALTDSALPKRLVKVCISGHDTTPQGKAEKAHLKQLALQLGFEVCGLNEYDWTHMVAKVYKTTDRTLISLACGRWILTPEWLRKSVTAGHALPEKEFEWRSTTSVNNSTTSIDPRMCRQAVERLGRGFFQGTRILYILPTPLWKTVLERSGATVVQYKSDPSHPLTISFIRQFDHVLTSTDAWDELSASDRSLLNKSTVVLCDFFVRYLTTAEEPAADMFHPASARR